MARIRSLKPEFWTDEKVGECSVSARLLFLGALNFADDHGGLDRSAKQLKAQVFPYDNLDLEALVQELLANGLWVEYEAGGKNYLHIIGFQKHQKIEKKSKPRVPVYDSSVKPPRPLTEPSPSSSGSSLGREKEGKGRDLKSASPKQIEAPVPHATLPLATWEQWLQVRRSRRWPNDPITLSKQLALLAHHPAETQRAMIEQSIQAGWQGIFPLKGNGQPVKPYRAPPTTAELEAEEAARASE